MLLHADNEDDTDQIGQMAGRTCQKVRFLPMAQFYKLNFWTVSTLLVNKISDFLNSYSDINLCITKDTMTTTRIYPQ